jgi:pyruvate,orthophosphate dikinase
MILADDLAGRAKALAKLLPMQRKDFIGIFRAMAGLPVTIRLLDPPLHEFLPTSPEQVPPLGAGDEGARRRSSWSARSSSTRRTHVWGHRGCRLGITYPEVYEMQARAIFEAAAKCAASKVEVHPEIMIPLVGHRAGVRRPRGPDPGGGGGGGGQDQGPRSYLVGTMIEVPRACLVAGAIAKEAEFFSFGTNDLTQMTYGFSRDDIGKFLPVYLDERILPVDPFQSIDQDGVRPPREAHGGGRPGRARRPQGGDLRRARGRSGLRRVLPSERSGLRFVLALPRPGRASRGRPRGAPGGRNARFHHGLIQLTSPGRGV